jgi:hypothetical protein
MYIPVPDHSPLTRRSNNSRMLSHRDFQRNARTYPHKARLWDATLQSLNIRQLGSMDNDDDDASSLNQPVGNHIHAVNIPEGDEEKARGMIMGMYSPNLPATTLD